MLQIFWYFERRERSNYYVPHHSHQRSCSLEEEVPHSPLAFIVLLFFFSHPLQTYPVLCWLILCHNISHRRRALLYLSQGSARICRENVFKIKLSSFAIDVIYTRQIKDGINGETFHTFSPREDWLLDFWAHQRIPLQLWSGFIIILTRQKSICQKTKRPKLDVYVLWTPLSLCFRKQFCKKTRLNLILVYLRLGDFIQPEKLWNLKFRGEYILWKSERCWRNNFVL